MDTPGNNRCKHANLRLEKVNANNYDAMSALAAAENQNEFLAPIGKAAETKPCCR